MIISSVKKLDDQDVETYAWRGLAQFLNIGFTSEQMIYLHRLPLKQHTNARRQAEQLRFCLLQAREYFDASKAVSIATRPVLLYYCAMSLALAEILLKQSGDSRLSELRATHNCHGLTLALSSTPKPPTDSLAQSISTLVAKPQLGPDGNPRGTFEVWRRSAREYPLAANFIETHETGTQTTFTALFVGRDEPPPILSRAGVSLLDCLTNLPYMRESLGRWGVGLNMVRASVQRELHVKSGEMTTTLITQPADATLLEEFLDRWRMRADYVNAFNVSELPSGYIARWSGQVSQVGQVGHMSLPHSTCINGRDIYFSCADHGVGEFGYLYLALHMLGNFARYYPDHWLKHIELHSPLASAAIDLCDFSLSRLPLLSLSEMTRRYHVPIA